MAEQQYDVVVLGGGTGGYVAAIRAAQHGLHTAVVEKAKVGGTCLHQGCIPTKALLHTAELLHEFQHSQRYGLTAQGVALDYPKTLDYKNQVVGQLYRGIQYLLKKNGITVISGEGRLVGPTRVQVGDETLVAQDVLVATGSVPKALPGVPFDGVKVVNSDHVLDSAEIPKSIMIVGAGAIGVEFASMYHDYGCQVTLIEALPHILPQDDEDVARELARLFQQRGIAVMAGASFDAGSVEITASTVRARVTSAGGEAQTIEADRLLIAIGRSAVTAGLGLEELGVGLERGFVAVDDHYRTSVPHVYAIGDVIGGYLLAHVAAHEGMIAVDTIAGKDPEGLSRERVPRVTYCRPEVASIGLTAAEAEAAGYGVKVGTFPFKANGRSLILGDGAGFVKLVADRSTDALLGAHIIGPQASELINEVALARFLEGTAWEMGESVHAHPTVSEVLHEAALAVDGQAIHI